MSERNLFEELKQGLEEILLHQQGKITLRTETLSKPEHIVEVLGRYKKGKQTISRAITVNALNDANKIE